MSAINQQVEVTKFDTLDEASVLRISKEPYSYFEEARVHHLLTQDPQDFFYHVHETLGSIARGEIAVELPGKQIFFDPDTEGDFRVMPCVVGDGASATKTVKLVGTNTIQELIPGQITVGKACVIHPVENYISHIFEACLLSSARTGICAMIGVELLAKRRERLAVVGAGRVGYYTGLYAAALGGVREIYFCDAAGEQAVNCAAVLGAKFPSVRITACEREQLPDVDVLVLATTSKDPICEPEASSPHLIVSVGADTDFQRELDPAWAGKASLFLETFDSVRYGDLRAWLAGGLIAKGQLTDLFSILNGQFVLNDNDKTRIFVSTGTALFDNIAISYILSRLEQAPAVADVALSVMD